VLCRLDFGTVRPIISPVQQLLVEIGIEELPASFLAPAALELERRVRTLLSERDIPAGRADVFYSPRRLAVRIDGVATGRPAGEIELQGPPRKAAFDPAGNPTKTAAGFSAAHGKSPADLYVKATPKGEYVFVRKTTEPVPTAAVLAAGMPGVIATLPFPKNMRWDGSGVRFARPVRWLVCLFGSEPVGFRFGDLTAGNRSFGHRNNLPVSFTMDTPADYEATQARHGVIADHATRRRTIEQALERLAAEAGGAPVSDEELIEETTDITESPELVLCSFRPEHLNLPPEVLITALKKHQRCFSIRRADGGGLLPAFVAVTNTPGCDRAAVAGWYEKAAESRLRDARFFVDADLHRGLEALVEDEKLVVWIEGMGSYFDKTQRLRGLCRFLGTGVPGTDAAALDRAATLCKADLLTNMVREKEYTSLQGRMGGVYARMLGETPAVADAIAEHYLPGFVGDRQPTTLNGGLLSIADKTDNIVATFLSGAIPTGSEDPFAARRQATGLLSIVLESGIPVDVGAMADAAAAQFPGHNPELAAQVPGFLRERLNALLAEKGIRYDIAAAVMETSWRQPAQAMVRARALSTFRDDPEFGKLVVGQKRVANILRGQEAEGLPDETRFAEPTERLLYAEARGLEPGLTAALSAHDFDRAFRLLLGLRPFIDRFFDDVLVMVPESEVRDNRLRLLGYVRSLFSRVADLSKVVIEGETAPA
jgi:glycyl-tRNA synthetase beta chain